MVDEKGEREREKKHLKKKRRTNKLGTKSWNNSIVVAKTTKFNKLLAKLRKKERTLKFSIGEK